MIGAAFGARRGVAVRVAAVVGLIMLAPLVLLACGGSGAPSSAAVTELRKLTPLKQGQPVLVFVYTDG